MSAELQTIPPAQLTPDDLATLKNTLCRGASDADMKLFALVCQRTQLDPFARQIYWIPGKGAIISIDGQRIISERSGKYRGMTDAQWCGPDGQWVDVWLSSTPPSACRVGVYRADARDAITAIATWQGYAQGGPQWTKNGPNMLAKCAESLARRKAFPQELSGLYTEDEMGEPSGSIYDEPPLRITEGARGESNSNSPQYKPPAQRVDVPPIEGVQHVSDALPPLVDFDSLPRAYVPPLGVPLLMEVLDGKGFAKGIKYDLLYVDEAGLHHKLPGVTYWNLAHAQQRSGMQNPGDYRANITGHLKLKGDNLVLSDLEYMLKPLIDAEGNLAPLSEGD